jgi:ABC-type transport system involved in multi-copper enzyme maturation permease subunit
MNPLHLIAIVAGATCREAVRSRAFLGLLAIFAVCALLARIVGWVSATDGHAVTTDLVLSLQSVIGVLVAVATGTALVQTEIQSRTLSTILSRPIERWQFVVGKYLGLATALAAGQAAMAILGLAWVGLTGAPVTGWLALGAAMTVLEVLVMAAVALCWTALTSPLLAAVLGLATYALGHAVAGLPDLLHHLKPGQQVLAASLASLVPNLGMFTYRSQALAGLPMAPAEILLRMAYAAAWCGLLVSITVAVLRRRQL